MGEGDGEGRTRTREGLGEGRGTAVVGDGSGLADGRVFGAIGPTPGSGVALGSGSSEALGLGAGTTCAWAGEAGARTISEAATSPAPSTAQRRIARS